MYIVHSCTNAHTHSSHETHKDNKIFLYYCCVIYMYIIYLYLFICTIHIVCVYVIWEHDVCAAYLADVVFDFDHHEKQRVHPMIAGKASLPHLMFLEQHS